MNIAVDIDDTLTDSFDYFLPFVAAYFGAPEAELREKNISYGNLPEAWKSRELDFCRACYDRTAVDTPFKPDAAWGVCIVRITPSPKGMWENRFPQSGWLKFFWNFRNRGRGISIW